MFASKPLGATRTAQETNSSAFGAGPALRRPFLHIKALVVVVLATGVAGCALYHAVTPEHHGDYNNPLLSPGAQFATLPPAVQNTIRAQTGGASIDEVVKDTASDRIVYHVYFQNHAVFPPLIIAPDGSVLDSNLTVVVAAPQERVSYVTGGPVASLTLSDVPPAVVKTIQHLAPDAEVDTILKQVHYDQTTYLVTFKNHMHVALRIASDGSVL